MIIDNVYRNIKLMLIVFFGNVNFKVGVVKFC